MAKILEYYEQLRINELYKEGLSIDKVAKVTGYARATVWKYIANPRPARSQRIVTPEMEVEMKALYQSGMRAVDIAKQYNIGVSTLRTHLRGVKAYKEVYTVKDRMRMNELYQQGYNMQAVADIFGCSYTTVARAIWNPRGKGARTNVKG